MKPLVLGCQHLPGVTLITVAGQLDTITSGQLDGFIRQVRRRPEEHVVLDLTELSFMDSSGLRVMLTTHSYSAQHGGSLRLAALRPGPARLLHIAGLECHLSIYANVQDALADAFATE